MRGFLGIAALLTVAGCLEQPEESEPTMDPPVVVEPEPEPEPPPPSPPLGEGKKSHFEVRLQTFGARVNSDLEYTATLFAEGGQFRWTFRGGEIGSIDTQLGQLAPGCRVTSIAIDHTANGRPLRAQLTSFRREQFGDVGAWSSSGTKREIGVMPVSHDPAFDRDGDYLVLWIYGVDAGQSIHGVHVEETCYPLPK